MPCTLCSFKVISMNEFQCDYFAISFLEIKWNIFVVYFFFKKRKKTLRLILTLLTLLTLSPPVRFNTRANSGRCCIHKFMGKYAKNMFHLSNEAGKINNCVKAQTLFIQCISLFILLLYSVFFLRHHARSICVRVSERAFSLNWDKFARPFAYKYIMKICFTCTIFQA